MPAAVFVFALVATLPHVGSARVVNSDVSQATGTGVAITGGGCASTLALRAL
jgi:hypothetical protein